MKEIMNAIIESAEIFIERDMLTATIFVNHKLGSQGFGGHCLYNKQFNQDFGGRFLQRVMEVAGVERWEDLPNKTIRIEANESKISAIGNIIEEDWFNIETDLAKK